jgi:hypothetical protein
MKLDIRWKCSGDDWTLLTQDGVEWWTPVNLGDFLDKLSERYFKNYTISWG